MDDIMDQIEKGTRARKFMRTEIQAKESNRKREVWGVGWGRVEDRVALANIKKKGREEKPQKQLTYR